MKAEVLEYLKENVRGCGIPACVSYEQLIVMMGATTEIQLNPMDRDQVNTLLAEIPYLIIDCTEEEFSEQASMSLIDMGRDHRVQIVREAWDADPDNDFGNPWLVLLARVNKSGQVCYWLAQETNIDG